MTDVEKKTVKIVRPVEQLILSHAKWEAPFECCGLIGGRNGFFTNGYPLHNVARFPRRCYEASPEDLIAVRRRMRQRGEHDLGIYHSHPKSPAFPSATDCAFAFYPEAIYFILSLHPVPCFRAFRISQTAIQPIEIQIFDE